MMKLGGRVQKEREALGWTQEELAARVTRLGRNFLPRKTFVLTCRKTYVFVVLITK